MKYYHVDVFSLKPMSGNGLTVVFPDRSLDDKELLSIAREFKQFETIFIYDKNQEGSFPVRIFTVDEELKFAGHPIIGACAVIHKLLFSSQNNMEISLDLSGRRLTAQSCYLNKSYNVTMNQGSPQFINEIERKHYNKIANALNIKECDIDDALPVEVISTGLPYLLVPLKSGLAQAKINMGEFESFLAGFEAKFVYVFDSSTLECRTWDNNGVFEDVVTGSAAGPLCAYLVKHGLKKHDEIIDIHQGQFVNRPSIIQGWVTQTSIITEVFIRGDVSFFSAGDLLL
ncbi:MAG: PhzF family phenazine biosynthesis protein [Anaerotignaceae bacterium]